MKKLIEVKRGQPVPDNATFLKTIEKAVFGKTQPEEFDVWEVPAEGNEASSRTNEGPVLERINS